MNAATLVVVMIETSEGLANANAIAAVPGVDVVIVGASDLSIALGIAGNTEHPRIIEAVEAVIAACRRHGKWPGMGGVGAETALKRYVAMGMRMILAGVDVAFLMQAATQRTSFLRSLTLG
jgi:2-keto-3-deoxy-L-rhamnonate aldolase RhmA